jgi:putative IMPACT (imprinted ancient) family translation regulator
MPFTIATSVHSAVIIKKSRVISCVQPMTGGARAQQVVNNLKT